MVWTSGATAILVLNYNGKAHLDACLGSVLAQTGPQDQVYVVDNGSTDGSMQYARQRFPAAKVIRFERNLGFAEAYNRAVRSISEELAVFLNNDVEVEENWLIELKSGLERSADRVAVCGSKVLFYRDRGLINHAGGKLAPIGGGIDLDFMKREKQQEHGIRCVGCVSGASMIVPRTVFLILGGFDPDFFAYFEDVDFCWRAWLAGYRVMYVPSSRVYHKLSATMGPFLNPKRIFLGEKNRLQSMLQNLGCGNLVVATLVSLVYGLSRLLTFPASRRRVVALAVLQGDMWVLQHLPKIVARRRQVQQNRRISDSFLARHGLMASLIEGYRELARITPLRLSDATR